MAIKQEHQINADITDAEVRLVGANGEQLGIMSAAKANAIADEQNLDLVKISPNAKPPVCKLMDYGKFMFDKAKREKENRVHYYVIFMLFHKVISDHFPCQNVFCVLILIHFNTTFLLLTFPRTSSIDPRRCFHSHPLSARKAYPQKEYASRAWGGLSCL